MKFHDLVSFITVDKRMRKHNPERTQYAWTIYLIKKLEWERY